MKNGNVIELDSRRPQPRKGLKEFPPMDERHRKDLDLALSTRTTRVMPAQKPGRSEQTVGTPWSLVHAVEKRWGGHKMDFDLAALPSNAKAARFFTPNDDALTKAWSKIEGLPKKDARLWLNNPYSNNAVWVGKSALFSKTTFCKLTGARVFQLLPAAVGSNWWAEYVHKRAAVYFIRPRVKFNGHRAGYPKDLALLVWGDKPGYHTWHVETGEVK
jgi:phage N-6-adenine-methyltransferase